MDKVLEQIGKAIALAAAQPWVLTSLGIVLISFTILCGWLTVWKAKQGMEVTIPGLLSIKPNELLVQAKAENDQLQADLRQMGHVIKLQQQLSQEIAKAISLPSSEEFSLLCKAVYRYALPGIGIILTKHRSNNHRVAIFVAEDDTRLKIYEGINYSPDGFKHLRLSIQDSAAGRVFRTGEAYTSGDITTEGNSFTTHPKASKKYHSLVCVPIKSSEQVLGVLSIDGEEKDSFSKEDVSYLHGFAHALAPFLYLEMLAGITPVEQGKREEWNGTGGIA